MKNKKFYLTTTIPYANAQPHIGFAFEIILTDVLARWHKLLEENVFFLTGTDEHGSKNARMAREVDLTPQQFVDKNSQYFRELTKSLNTSNNYFIRTTDKRIHWPGVFKIWKILEKKGDIYKQKYDGLYCSGCERFVTEKDLIDNKCPDHPNLELESISEENYFFKLSKYSNKITELIKKDKIKITPKKYKNDFLALIKNGLTDVSFSRDKKHLSWGIPVPGSKDQVMYVWADALTNYLTGIGYPKNKYHNYWPADVHVVGKDMLRFHTGIWPGMLLSAGIKLPKEVIVHGFLTVDGQKMSKSLGNVVSPLELRKKYDADSIRYYLMRTIPMGEDGNFSEKSLIERHNNELANKFGNLVSRITTLAETNGLKKCKNNLLKKLKLTNIKKQINNYEFDKALILIFEFIDECNLYIQKNEIWKTKDQKQIYELIDSIKVISILLWPFIPESCEKVATTLQFKIKDIKQINKPIIIKSIKKSNILFNKIEETFKPKKEEPKMAQGVMDYTSIEDFSKFDIRIGTIKAVQDHPQGDKLYILLIQFDDQPDRQILAGIKRGYKMNELIGKQVPVIVNLKPVTLRGIESNGMLLAAVDKHDNVSLLTVDRKIANNSKVR